MLLPPVLAVKLRCSCCQQWEGDGTHVISLAAMLWSLCCGRLLRHVQAEMQRDVSKENCPSKWQAHVPESTLKRCGRVLVGEKVVTWLCKQRYWNGKFTSTVKHWRGLSAVRALGMPGSHCAHVCNIKVQLRGISFICVPQAADPYYFSVPGELLLRQRITSNFYLFVLLKFKKLRGHNFSWNLACGLLADLSKCCFPIRALPFLCSDLKI